MNHMVTYVTVASDITDDDTVSKKDMGNSFEVVYLDDNEKKSNLRINFLLHIPKCII